MALIRRLYRQFSLDPVYPNSDDEEFFIGNESHIWLTDELFKHIGRSRICVLREHYLDLCSMTRTRDPKDIFTSPLHVAAAEKKRYQLVEHILKNGNIDRNIRNRFGETPLLLALKENVDQGIINLLIEYGSDCNIACFRGISPLHIAALDNRANYLLTLIAKGAEVNSVSNVGVTPLHLAVLASNYEIVYHLLNNNANPKLVTTLEFTPLMLALSFQDVDVRICELLCSHDIHTGTRVGNPLYCAIKGQHCFVEKLILEGADVNYVGRVSNTKISCLVEAISQSERHLFDLIWPRFDQEIFSKKLTSFLVYFAASCGLKGNDLVECLELILKSQYSIQLLNVYFTSHKRSFLQNFFEALNEYQLTNEHCRRIIRALPAVHYDDILYVYRKFHFNRELVDLLMSYDVREEFYRVENTSRSMYIDFLCYNRVERRSHNLKEIAHYFKYRTPDITFRTHYYGTFASIGASTDQKLERLIRLHRLCEEVFVKRNMASLQELARDKIRNMLFLYNRKPYMAISTLPVPEMFKDILLLKMPIYC